MESTVDKLEQMGFRAQTERPDAASQVQNVEVTLDCMYRRMRWEMQQEKDGSFPLDPLLPFEELKFFQKRLVVLVGEAQEIRAQKHQTMAAIEGKMSRITQLASDVQSRAAVPGVAVLLPAEHHAEDAPVPVAAVPQSRPDARDAPVQPQPPDQGKGTRPGRGGAQDRRTGQSSAGAPAGARGRRASTPPGKLSQATGKGTRPGQGGAQDGRTSQSSAGAPPRPRGRRASTPPGGPLRRRRPPL